MKRTIAVAAVLALSAGFAWAAVRSQEGAPKVEKEHAFLRKFVGTWDSTLSMRHNADEPWTEVKGTEEVRMIGDFWAITEWKPGSNQIPMHGLGATGYDPVKKKYIATWLGNMSPTLALSEGTVDAAGKVLTMQVECNDCSSGKSVSMTMVQEFKDKDTLVWSMKGKDKDGKEFDCMKGESKRKK